MIIKKDRFSNIDIIYSDAHKEAIENIIKDLDYSMNYLDLLAFLKNNTNVYYSFVELKSNNFQRSRHSALHHPYTIKDLIESYSSVNTDNVITIYLSMHEYLAIDALYLNYYNSNLNNPEKVMEIFDIFYKNSIQSPGYTGEYIVQSIPVIYDNGFTESKLVLNQILIDKQTNELVISISKDYHYLNGIMIPTTNIYRKYEEFTNASIPYLHIDRSRIKEQY